MSSYSEAGWHWDENVPVIQDVCSQAHRLHQFGAGRWKFNVESPLENGDWDGQAGQPTTMEIFKPFHPFLINWEIVQLGQKKKGVKKPGTVKAMPDWRNPLGFACNCDDSLPAQELIGVCASVQGLQSGSQAFVAGASVLGMNHLPLLLSTLDPRKYELKYGFTNDSSDVRAVRILHHEIYLPPGTLTQDVLWKMNQVRAKALEALTPWEPQGSGYQRYRGQSRSGGVRGQYIWVGDISQEMLSLLEEVWDSPDPVVEPRHLRWCNAWMELEDDLLSLLQPLVEGRYFEAAMPSSGAALMPKSKNKQAAKGKGAHPAPWPGAGGEVADAPVNELMKYLASLPWPHEEKLSAIGGRFHLSKKTLSRYTHLVQATFSDSGHEVVRLVGYPGTAQPNGRTSRKEAPRGQAAAAGAGARGSARGTFTYEAKIKQLVSQDDIMCSEKDFDSTVRNWLQRFEQRRGSGTLNQCFTMLSESLANKDNVKAWPKYLLVLVRNWEKAEFTHLQ